MSMIASSRPTGWRILGFGKHPEIAAAVQEKLRSLGFQATTFVLTNDEAGDARLVSELKRAEYDGVVIGGYINGQDAVNFPATEETTVWFNRVLNIVHANAPSTKIILVRGPDDVVPAIERVLGKNLPS
jgi:DNA-binding LacI/PurR family transcriptional regulator